MSSFSIPHPTDICVASNEILNRYTFNRNFEKLLENDTNLANLYYSTIDITNNITPYIQGIAYNKGSYVWFSDKETKSVYLLQSLIGNNTNYPVGKFVNSTYVFDDSAWQDKNQLAGIIKNSFKAYVLENISRKFSLLHANNATYHKFKNLTDNPTYNETKLLLKNLDNIEVSRKTNFYPYETIQCSPDTVIQKGFYRKWENGLLEYDLTFRLGFVKTKLEDYVTYDMVKTNDIKVDYSLNSMYFKAEKDTDIFSNSTSPGVDAEVKNMIQTNRTKFVNSYSGLLLFPQSFLDNNYMVFGSDVTRQSLNTSTASIDSGANTITYVNKKPTSICPLYLMFEDNSNKDPTTSGLISNSFHCQIIGKWK